MFQGLRGGHASPRVRHVTRKRDVTRMRDVTGKRDVTAAGHVTAARETPERPGVGGGGQGEAGFGRGVFRV